MSEEIISHRQLFFIIYIMRTFVVISYMPTLTSGEALQDAWLSTLVALLFALPQVCNCCQGRGFGDCLQHGPRLWVLARAAGNHSFLAFSLIAS